jgi:parallel beta-helix repeat protein
VIKVVFKRHSAIFVLFAVFLIFGTAQLCFSTPQNTKIIRVPLDYLTIQEAVNAADTGDTVLVAPGLYNESVFINKPIKLVGEDPNNTIIDGGGYDWDRVTIALSVCSGNVTIDGFTIKNAYYGIYAENANYTTVQNNIFSSNGEAVRVINSFVLTFHKNVVISNNEGVFIENSSMCTIKDNVFENNWGGGPSLYFGCGISLLNLNNSIIANNFLTKHIMGAIELSQAYENMIVNNLVIDNSFGVNIYVSYNNVFHHNNFVNNWVDIDYMDIYSFNFWDDGFEGNYWDEYNGTDADQDGIGDSPYIRGQCNDNHPLMGIFSNFSFPWQEQDYFITTISNSTITDFQFDSTLRMISFNVNGSEGEKGFCRVAIPNTLIQDLWQSNYTVLINGGTSASVKNWTTGEYILIYLTYQFQHPSQKITILPEFQTTIILALLMTVSTIATILTKKKRLHPKLKG